MIKAILFIKNSNLFADFWGGKTEQGQALDNTII